MNKFIEVEREEFFSFMSWARKNIEGFDYDVVSPNRSILRGEGDTILGYKELKYTEHFYIEEKVYEKYLTSAKDNDILLT